MTDVPRKRSKQMGRPKKDGPKIQSTSITLFPSEIAVLDRLMDRFDVRSRGEVIRKLLKDHPVAQKEAA